MKTIFFALFLCLFFVVARVQAQALNEIMYSPDGADAGHEWVEILNTGSGPIDLEEYTLYENNVFHSITVYSHGDCIIGAGEYAIIADKADVMQGVLNDSSIMICDSVFSLNNSGEEVGLADVDDTVISTYTYSASSNGADGTGESLQFYDGQWVAASPTPGSDNSNTAISSEEEEDDDDDETSSEEEEEDEESQDTQDADPVTQQDTEEDLLANEAGFFVRPELPEVIFPHVQYGFQWDVVYRDDDKEYFIEREGYYRVSMGDGTVYQRVWDRGFTHRYTHPGKVTIVFEYWDSFPGAGFHFPPVLTYESVIDVIGDAPTIGGHTPGDHVTIKNTSNQRLELGGWHLVMPGVYTYTVPRSTFIQPESSLTLSYETMKAPPLYRREPITLHYPDMDVVAGWPPPVQEVTQVESKGNIQKVAQAANASQSVTVKADNDPQPEKGIHAPAAAPLDSSEYLLELLSTHQQITQDKTRQAVIQTLRTVGIVTVVASLLMLARVVLGWYRRRREAGEMVVPLPPIPS